MLHMLCILQGVYNYKWISGEPQDYFMDGQTTGHTLMYKRSLGNFSQERQCPI